MSNTSNFKTAIKRIISDKLTSYIFVLSLFIVIFFINSHNLVENRNNSLSSALQLSLIQFKSNLLQQADILDKVASELDTLSKSQQVEFVSLDPRTPSSIEQLLSNYNITGYAVIDQNSQIVNSSNIALPLIKTILTSHDESGNKGVNIVSTNTSEPLSYLYKLTTPTYSVSASSHSVILIKRLTNGSMLNTEMTSGHSNIEGSINVNLTFVDEPDFKASVKSEASIYSDEGSNANLALPTSVITAPYEFKGLIWIEALDKGIKATLVNSNLLDTFHYHIAQLIFSLIAIVVGFILTLRQLENTKIKSNKQTAIHQHLVSSQQIATVRFNINSGKTRYSNTWLELVGLSAYKSNEDIQKEWDKIIHDDDELEFQTQLTNAIVEQQTEFYLHYRVKVGSLHYKTISCHAIIDYENGIANTVTRFERDVTPKNIQPHSEKLQNDKFRQIVEEIDVPFLIFDTNGQIVRANESAVAFYGYSTTQIRELHIDDIRAHSSDDNTNQNVHKLSSGDLVEVTEQELTFVPDESYIVFINAQQQGTDNNDIMREFMSISHEKLSPVLELTTGGYWQWFPQDKRLVRSNRYLELLGFTGREKNAEQEIQPEDLELLTGIDASELIASVTINNATCKTVTIAGNQNSTHHLDVKVTLTYNEKAELISVIGCANDLSLDDSINKIKSERAEFTANLNKLVELYTTSKLELSNSHIIKALNTICSPLNICGAAFVTLSNKENTLSMSDFWYSIKGHTIPTKIKLNDNYWISSQLSANKQIYLTKAQPQQGIDLLNALPSNAVALLPLVTNQHEDMFLCFFSEEENFSWPIQSKLQMQIMSSLVSNALNLIYTAQSAQRKNAKIEKAIFVEEDEYVTQHFDNCNIIGSSPSLMKVLSVIEKVAPTDTTVLITGESGTGKELLAEACYKHSQRVNKPYIKLNCAALTPSLLESELFGHEKGAFTGALSTRIGRFEQADGGTLFLDEVSEMDINLQAKLLRVLQEGEFERLGGHETIKVDVRLIAASNRDLQTSVKNNEFREDLYFRLNVVPLHSPNLRDRREDIPALAKHFISHFAEKLGKDIDMIPSTVMSKLIRYSWPGNVREMRNLIEHAVVISKGSTFKIPTGVLQEELPVDSDTSLKPLMDVERAYILKVLKLCNWRVEGVKGAANILDLNPGTLRSRMKKLGITKTEQTKQLEEA